MRIPLSEVPIVARRIAAQHLVSIHGTEMTAGVEGTIADYAVPIYRPDIEEVAYYEFAVRSSGGGKRILQSSDYLLACRDSGVNRGEDKREAVGAAIGFVVVTNGRHDFPISHWSLNREPPSEQAEHGKAVCECAADGQRGEAVRVYRLDALAYVAEDANGDLVGQSGQMPGLLSGLPHSLETLAGAINTSTARGVARERTDESAASVRHELDRSGPKEPPALQMEDKGGWKAFKARYADAFGPLLDHLRGRAAKTWELHDLIEKMGEGIEAGTTHRVALLESALLEFTGPARKFVRPRLDEGNEGPPTLVLETERARLQTELDLDVHISYGNGEREILKFFLYSRDIPSNERSRRDGGSGNCDCEE